jgi:hypothetical protein
MMMTDSTDNASTPTTTATATGRLWKFQPEVYAGSGSTLQSQWAIEALKRAPQPVQEKLHDPHVRVLDM